MFLLHFFVKKFGGALVAWYLCGIGDFIALGRLDIGNNPKIKRLPKLPNTLKAFFSNHKFEVSVQPVLYHDGSNCVMLDNGHILWCVYRWYSLGEFKAWLTKREDADKFAPFISECEAYLAKLNPNQSK